MRFRALYLFSFLLCLFACGVFAAEPPRPKSAVELSLEPIEDVPGLPRVLLIGDSISMGYTVSVRQLLAGKANVHRVPANAAATIHTLAKFDEWVGPGKWDAIHFNWGLHDIKIMPNGQPQVGIADYEKNLRELVRRLRESSSTLIWCATTPVPGTELDPPRRNEDVIAYNEVARRVMLENGVFIDDLYSFALPRVGRIRKPLDVHYTPQGYSVLAQQVAKCIEQVLRKSQGAQSR